MDIDESTLIQIGLGLAGQKKYDEAAKYFTRSIRLEPTAQAHYFLGLTYQRMKKDRDAKACFLKAHSMDSSLPQPLNGLGLIYLNSGDYPKALKYFKKAITINPLGIAAHNNIANVYKKMDKENLAIKFYKRAIKIDKSKAEPYCNLGTVYYQKGDVERSLDYLKKSVRINPDYPLALYHLGMVYRKLEKPALAQKYLERHLKLSPQNAEGYGVLGNVFLEQGKLNAAQKNFKKSLTINPLFAQGYNDMGNLYKKNNDYKNAIKYYQKALSLNGNLAGAESNLGITISNVYGKTELGIKHLKRAVMLDENCLEGHYHLGVVYEKIGEFEKATEHLLQALKIDPNFNDALAGLVFTLMQMCDYETYNKHVAKLDKLTKSQIKKGERVSEPALLNVARCEDLKQNLSVASSWSSFIEKNVSASRPDFKFSKKAKKVLNIGYLSCDFYDHATAHLMLGLFEKHDRKKFKIYTYSYGPDDKSDYRKKIIKDSDAFVDLQKIGNIEAAKKIYSDGIDILVDLKGFTKDSRLEIAALKPAPVQVSYLGFPGTLGADFIDYIITDRIITPSTKYYTEKAIYLPCYQVNDDKQKISKAKLKRSDFGLSESGVVFSSFNNPYKISEETFESWMRIVKKVPKSVMWIYAVNESTRENLKRKAKKLGVNSKRIIFADKLPKPDHLARIALSDIALDTLTYNGHTTTSDCLWAGVPVVAKIGKHFASRVSASLLTAAGLPELVTRNAQQYEKLAVKLALDRKKLRSLKELTRKAKKSLLFNTDLFVKELEKGYLKMWKNYLNDKI